MRNFPYTLQRRGTRFLACCARLGLRAEGETAHEAEETLRNMIGRRLREGRLRPLAGCGRRRRAKQAPAPSLPRASKRLPF